MIRKNVLLSALLVVCVSFLGATTPTTDVSAQGVSDASSGASDQAADKGSPGVRLATAPGVRESTSAIMQRQAAAPPPRPRPEHEVQYPDRSNLPQNQNAPAIARYPSGSGPSAPSPLTNIHTTSNSFDGATLTDTGAFPPDSMGTVGPTQFIVFVNGRIRSFTKAGVADGVMNADPDVFFSSVETPVSPPVVLNFTSDPQIRYDRFSGRWFMSIIDVPCTNATCTATAANRWMVAVSDAASNGTISGSTVWTFFFFQADPGTNFCDYPSLGIDVNALYVGCNMFTSAGAFVGTNGYVVQKTSTLGAGPILVTAFANMAAGTGAGPESPRGVDNFDSTATEGYFVGPDNATFSTIMFRRISNPGSATPTISANIGVTVPTTTLSGTQTIRLVQHLGNTGGNNGLLDSIDDRFYQAMIRNGRLWAAHNFTVSSAGVASTAASSRNASRWYEFQNLTTTPTLRQSGTVFDNAGARASARQYWMPSVAVTGQGHAVMGMTMAGSPVGATPAYVGRLAGDTLGTMTGPPTVSVVQTGTTTANYNPPSDPGGASGRRWGDYSFTVVDPLDDMSVWTIQEYNQALNSYAVRVAQLAAPPPATPTCATTAVNFPAGTGNVVINATSSGGSGFYDPGTDLPSPALPFKHISAALSAGTLNSVTYNSPTQVTLNVSDTTTGSVDVTITNPDGQSVTATGCIKVVAGPPATIAITSQPASNSDIAAGANIAFVANVQDSFGNPVSGDNVTLAIANNPGSSTLSATTNPVATDTSGNATFSGVSLNRPGTGYTLTAADGTAPTATSNAFNIIVGPPASIAFTTQPATNSDVVAGTAIPLVAHVQDSSGNAISGDNVTLAIANNAGGSTLSVTTNPVATDASGDATFAGVSLNKSGAGYTLKVTESTALTTTGNAFNITPAAAASLAFSVQPSNTTAGVAIAPAVQVSLLDGFGNLETGDSTDHVTLVLATGVDPSFTGGGSTQLVNGIATFAGLTLTKAASGYSLRASTDAGSFTATSTTFKVSPAAADHIGFTVQPSNTSAGATITPAVVVTEFDQFNNVETTDSTTSVTLTANGPGSLGGTTSHTLNSGAATFGNLTISTVGTYTLSANAGGLLATSNSFVISPGTGAQLVFMPQPADVNQGDFETVHVAVEDFFGNVVTADNTTQITLSAPTCAGPVVIGTATVVSGVATFSHRFYTAGSTSLTASSGTATPVTSSPFNVIAADFIFADGFDVCRP